MFPVLFNPVAKLSAKSQGQALPKPFQCLGKVPADAFSPACGLAACMTYNTGIHTCRFPAFKMLRKNSISGRASQDHCSDLLWGCPWWSASENCEPFHAAPAWNHGCFPWFSTYGFDDEIDWGTGCFLEAFENSQPKQHGMSCEKWLYFSCLFSILSHVRLSRSSGRTKHPRSGIGPTQFFRSHVRF